MICKLKKEKIKVYLYTRVSTTMQIDGYSLDAQKTTKVPVTARNKQHSNINKKKKEYGVFLSIDASEMKKLYDYKEVVIDAQYFSKRDIQTFSCYSR